MNARKAGEAPAETLESNVRVSPAMMWRRRPQEPAGNSEAALLDVKSWADDKFKQM
jgi:hypothetical protein